jgi:hypothetical protein
VRLTKLYVRFFRSFNFDYERKASRDAKPRDWEMMADAGFSYREIKAHQQEPRSCSKHSASAIKSEE